MIYLLLINPITLLVVYVLYAYTYTRQNTSVVAKILYWIVTGIGAVLDMVVNVTYGTLIFLDWPKEWLLTQRIERLKSKSGYRGKLATKLCWLLNYILPAHCK